MAIFTPTAFYFNQPVISGGGGGGGYIIRPDTYASSVTVAIPGTQFGSTFGQSSFRSDISGYINGGSSFADAAVTGSVTTSATTNFSSVPYGTSISRATNANFGTLPGTSTQVAFGTGDFTIEWWFQRTGGTSGTVGFWYYNNGCGFMSYAGGAGTTYYRWVAQNSTAGETLKDYAAAFTAGTWYHVMFCRSGSTWYGGLNGTIRANLTLSGATGTSTGFQMGGVVGTMDTTLFQDFRVTKGVARYTGAEGSSYTVPQSIVTTS